MNSRPEKSTHTDIPLLSQRPHIDTNGEHADVYEAIFHLNTFRQSFRAEDATDSLSEMSGKVGRLEADQVCAEDASQQFIANRQAAEDLR